MSQCNLNVLTCMVVCGMPSSESFANEIAGILQHAHVLRQVKA